MKLIFETFQFNRNPVLNFENYMGVTSKLELQEFILQSDVNQLYLAFSKFFPIL